MQDLTYFDFLQLEIMSFHHVVEQRELSYIAFVARIDLSLLSRCIMRDRKKCHIHPWKTESFFFTNT